METVTKKLYEGMFLIDSALAASSWDEVLGGIKKILDKVDAEVISMRKWKECRLAYEIDHKSRGTYILVYFRVEGTKVGTIEREVQLSEDIMRVLILNAEHMSEEDLQKTTPAEIMENRLTKAAEKTEQDETTPLVEELETSKTKPEAVDENALEPESEKQEQ